MPALGQGVDKSPRQGCMKGRVKGPMKALIREFARELLRTCGNNPSWPAPSVQARQLFTLPILLAAGLSLVAGSNGCSRTLERNGEGGYCSAEDEEPFSMCREEAGLKCFGPRDATAARHSCRFHCTSADATCQIVGHRCCQGKVVGPNFGSSWACVPFDQCPIGPDPSRPPAD